MSAQGEASYSPLLEEHSHSSQCDTTQHGLRLEERSNSYKLQLDDRPSRAVGQVREVLGCRTLFEHRLRFDLEEFKLDQVVVLRQVTEAGESLAGLSFAAVVDEPSRREGLSGCKWMPTDHGKGQYYHENHADEEDQGGEELKAQGDQPCGVRLSLASTSDVVGAWVTFHQFCCAIK